MALFSAWAVHWDAHLDGIVAIALAVLLPEPVLGKLFQLPESAQDWLERLASSESGGPCRSVSSWQCFCNRNAGFKKLPTYENPASIGGGNNIVPGTNGLDFAVDDDLDVVGAGVGYVQRDMLPRTQLGASEGMNEQEQRVMGFTAGGGAGAGESLPISGAAVDHQGGSGAVPPAPTSSHLHVREVDLFDDEPAGAAAGPPPPTTTTTYAVHHSSTGPSPHSYHPGGAPVASPAFAHPQTTTTLGSTAFPAPPGGSLPPGGAGNANGCVVNVNDGFAPAHHTGLSHGAARKAALDHDPFALPPSTGAPPSTQKPPKETKGGGPLTAKNVFGDLEDNPFDL